MSINTECLVEEFTKTLGEKPYFTGSQLIEIGLFGSPSAVTNALKSGVIPSIKISQKRRVVPRSAVVKYFRENLLESTV